MNSYIDALEGHIRVLKFWQSIAGKRVAEILSAPDGSVAGAGVYMHGLISRAETYYVGPDICDLLMHVADSVPDNAELSRDLPSESGFVWLAKPWAVSVPSVRGAECALRAYTWHTQTLKELEGLGIFTFEDELGFKSLPAVSGALFLPFDCGVGDVSFVSQGEPISEDDARRLARFQYSLLSFIRDNVIRVDPTRATRAARRRLDPDWRPDPLIRVITLRRIHSHTAAANDAGAVEWSHRWMVGGHWRQQWYPSLQKHQPKWISPYVKGPDDKPLKPPRARVFAVVR